MEILRHYFLNITLIAYLIYYSECSYYTDKINFEKMFIGSQYFREMVQTTYYIDKTEFIEHFLKNKINKKNILISRPRRFGKSLNLDMFRTYVEFKVDESNGTRLPIEITNEYFKEKKIDKFDEKTIYMGRFPVIHVDFRCASGQTYNHIENMIKHIISVKFIQYKYILEHESLEDFEREQFQKYIKRDFDYNQLITSLKFLSKMLKKYFEQKVFVLIDEYDRPFIDAYLKGPCKYNTKIITPECELQRKKIVNLFREIFKNSLKENEENVERGLIMGVAPIADGDIFSSNNIAIYTVFDTKFYTDFGFSKSDVMNLLEKSGKNYSLDQVISWYNGYQYDDKFESFYNPVSIMNFLNKNKTNCYWAETGDTALLEAILELHPNKLWSDLLCLMKGKAIRKSIDSCINVKDLSASQNAEIFYTTAVHYGYLNAKSISNNYYELTIPNYEIHRCFSRMLLNWLEYTKYGTSYEISYIGDLLFTALETNNFNTISEKISIYFQEYLDYIVPKAYGNFSKRKEEFFHDFIFLCFDFAEISEHFTIKAKWSASKINNQRKDNTAFKEIDIGILPKYSLIAIFLEIKMAKSMKELTLMCKDKIEIKTKAYATFIHNFPNHPKAKKILIVRMVFYYAEIVHVVINSTVHVLQL